ncbi:MAG TPA: sulfatase-like hydrolase/transferase, partial [Pseudomonadales bacterium]|nr:sulfatase-like hydrolase/transferase [Pseudomonadales bacterium]
MKTILSWLLIGLLYSVVQAAPVPPNFVVIVADDLGANDLGVFGHSVIKSPNIDQLAKQGMQFNNA